MFAYEYSLLVVVALPVAVVVAVNVILAATGEKGTLLLPSLRPFPRVEMPRTDIAPERVGAVGAEAANFEELKQAA